MKTKIKWMQDVSFKGSSESGHEVVLDGPEELGGKGLGMRPMEMMLIGMGGCTSFDVVTILKRSRQQITGCIAEIEAIRADEIPKVFTSIHIHFLIKGIDLQEKAVERAIELSANKYCSASIMLGKSVKITHDFVISEE
ncbi:OsmC family protein [Methylophilaceae bacterium]|nr:OsmC family protein [Methylophilaceae bacterium]MDC6477513.1 OsmC family protein [Methylophilaceae bacterium]